MDFWTLEEFQKVISLLYKGDYYEHYLFTSFWLLFMTGLRIGEAAALQWSDIDFETGLLSITKTLYYKSMDDYKFVEPKTQASVRTIDVYKRQLIDSRRMTQNRVLDMVAYLFGKHEAPDKYKQILMDKIAYQDIFNYQLERYQQDYDKTALWDCFFMGLPELRYIIEQRRIQNLDELIYRASSYFEKYQ